MKAWIAAAIICGITALIIAGLWSVRDQHLAWHFWFCQYYDAECH